MNNILDAYRQVPAIARETGYEMKTTFWGDFTVAEILSGEKGVKDTYKRSFNSYKDDKEYGTELSLVLNWKGWQHYGKENNELAKLYSELWEKIDQYIMDNWKGEDLEYYIKRTD